MPWAPIPEPGDGHPTNDNGANQQESDMATVPQSIAEQGLARLLQSGVQAHEHFVQFGKVLDYSYEQDRKMVSLVEALGVREVTSRSGHVGVPMAGGNMG